VTERVVLVTVHKPGYPRAPVAYSQQELSRLVQTAGGHTVDMVVVSRERPDPATYIGSGSAEALAGRVADARATTVVFDDELTPAQLRNLERIVRAKIIDRTRLILDIFARRARSREALLQVEAAQLAYLLPRLTRRGVAMDNQVGGIGTRGPGETKLETDRRRIMARQSAIRRELRDIARSREVQKGARRESSVPTVALIGYTNAGKSTLFNALAGRTAAYADDKLFATLDPLVRRVELAPGCPALVVDTVGFIGKLPHHLVESFTSTLDVVRDATLLLHVQDITDPERAEHAEIVRGVLASLSCARTPRLTVYTKCDLLPAAANKMYTERVRAGTDSLRISAVSGAGVDVLRQVLLRRLYPDRIRRMIRLRPDQYGLIGEIYRSCTVVARRMVGDRMTLTIVSSPAEYRRISAHIRDEHP